MAYNGFLKVCTYILSKVYFSVHKFMLPCGNDLITQLAITLSAISNLMYLHV